MTRITKETQIALVAVVGIVVLFLGLKFLKGQNFFSSNDTYYIAFDNVSGLTPSAAIFADGYKIGSVNNIEYGYGNGQKTIATIGVNNNMRIPKGATAEIESDMLGNVTVNILMVNNPRERVEPGDTITGSKSSGTLGKVSAMVPTIEKMLPKLDSIMGSLNVLLANPALAHTLHNVEGITANLTVITREMHTLIAAANDKVPALLDHATATMDNAKKISGELANADLQGSMERLNSTLANLHEITESITNKEGTVGLLLNDKELYNRLNSAVASADSLLKDLKNHPKRYVHFSVFGRKDNKDEKK